MFIQKPFPVAQAKNYYSRFSPCVWKTQLNSHYNCEKVLGNTNEERINCSSLLTLWRRSTYIFPFELERPTPRVQSAIISDFPLVSIIDNTTALVCWQTIYSVQSSSCWTSSLDSHYAKKTDSVQRVLASITTYVRKHLINLSEA